MSGDLVDLGAYRAKKRGDDAAEKSLAVRQQADDNKMSGKTYVLASGPDEVEMCFSIVNGPCPVMTVSGESARLIGQALVAASREAARLAKTPCSACGVRGCRKWHVGQLRRGWHHRSVTARVAKVCRTTVRLEPIDGGLRFYVSDSSVLSWSVVGWADPAPPLPPAA